MRDKPAIIVNVPMASSRDRAWSVFPHLVYLGSFIFYFLLLFCPFPNPGLIAVLLAEEWQLAFWLQDLQAYVGIGKGGERNARASNDPHCSVSPCAWTGQMTYLLARSRSRQQKIATSY